jgi:hypothetical protein
MLNFKKTQANLVISGKTFYAKEAIKAVGGKWDPSTSSWMLPVHIDSEMLRKDLMEKAVLLETQTKKKEKEEAKAAREFARSPEGIAAAKEAERLRILECLEQKNKTGAYHWICCEKCTVIDWARQHTSCQACAEWSGQSWNTFRVRGSIFTGD